MDARRMDDAGLEDACRQVLLDEAAAVAGFAEAGAGPMARAVRLIHGSDAPLIVAGIGKSGHVAAKIASTFRSIGKAAIFLHPAEASHGDLGLVAPGSVILILSNSGETTELSDLLAYAHAHDHPVVAITGAAASTLARAAAVAIAYGPVTEVCPNGLAPTTSTTLSLAIGDALAVGVTHLLGTLPEDFRRYHPGGKLGAALLRVSDLMHVGAALPVVAPATPMREALLLMTEKALGVAIVAEGRRVRGIVTDGDLRRNADRLWTVTAGEIASASPVSVDRRRCARPRRWR